MLKKILKYVTLQKINLNWNVELQSLAQKRLNLSQQTTLIAHLHYELANPSHFLVGISLSFVQR